MKKTIILAIILFHIGAGLAYAGQFGPAEPQSKQGRTYVGVGYHHYVDRWEFRNLSTDVRQEQVFAQMHLVLFPSGEVYLKLGSSNLAVDQGLTSMNGINDFSGGSKLYETVGLKGVFYRGPYLDMGGFAEASIFSAYEDATVTGTRLSIDNIIGANIGLTFQRRVDGGHLYAGPFFHYLEAEYHTDPDNILALANGGRTSGILKPKNYFGGFLGFRIVPSKNLAFTGELQLREDVSVGASVSFQL